MSAIGSVQIGSRTVNLYKFTSEVMDSQRSSETQVTSYNNGQVSSTTHHYNEVFLRAPNGEEISLEIGSSRVSVRQGNTVTVAWGILGNRERGPYTTVYNHNTKSIGHMAKPINDLAGPPGYNMLIILFVIIGVVSVFNLVSLMGLLGVGATAGFFYWLLQRRKKLRTAIESAIHGADVAVETSRAAA